MDIPADIVATVCPAAPVTWADHLSAAADCYGIDTADRAAMWLAQLAHESAGLTILQESLSYRSAERIAAVWPSRFTVETAGSYVRAPQRLANAVYARRMGNGDAASGDGWRYRGRGLIQLTGRDTYRACGAAIGLPLLDEPDLLLQPGPAALSASWYWQSRRLNRFADAGDIAGCTRAINGGLTGLADRQSLWRRARMAWGLPGTP